MHAGMADRGGHWRRRLRRFGTARAACFADGVGGVRRRASSGDAARAPRRAPRRVAASVRSRAAAGRARPRRCACWRAATRCCSASARRSARQLPAGELRVLPAPSSLSLAAARLGWPLQDVATVSLVGPSAGVAERASARRRARLRAERGRAHACSAGRAAERARFRRDPDDRARASGRRAGAPYRRPRGSMVRRARSPR